MRHSVAKSAVTLVFAFALTLALVLGVACGGSEQGSAPPEGTGSAKPPREAAAKPEPTPAEQKAALIKEGAGIYNSTCASCHNLNPNLAGSIGPAIAGSSLALLEAKVVHNTYPPGYTPKRETNAMIPLPHLEPKIPAIHAYIESKTE